MATHILFVLHSLADLEAFIKHSENGLLKKVEKGDFQGLVEIMGHLVALKERQSSTDDMFEPLKQTIELLKTYGQELPETVFEQLKVSAKSMFSNKGNRGKVWGFQSEMNTVKSMKNRAYENSRSMFWK